jgi:Protein of unknown function (DUF3054)
VGRTATRWLPAAIDGAAILLFAAIGLASHHHGLTPRGLARDALPLLAGWFGAALVFRPYTVGRRRRLLVTWTVGIPAGVLLRALLLGRTLDGKEAAFLGVALATIGLFVIVLRTLAAITRASSHPDRSAP